MVDDGEKNKIAPGSTVNSEPGATSLEQARENEQKPDNSARVDQQIRELEEKLAEIKILREQDSGLRDLAEEQKERQAIASVNTHYKGEELKREKTELGPGQAKSDLGNLKAGSLLKMPPNDAVASLVALAKKNAQGFHEAVQLVRKIALKQGGSWILDQFHLIMTKDK